MSHWISPHDVDSARRLWAKMPAPVRQAITSATREIWVFGRDTLQFAVAALRLWRSQWLWWALFMVVALTYIVGWVMPNDVAWLSAISQASGSRSPDRVLRLARFLSSWGDLLGFNLCLIGLIYLWSKYRRSLHWRRVAIACALGTVVCGSIATTARFATGRARPTSGQPPEFHGPDFRSRYQSFPSGHTATAFGMSVPLAVAAPVVGGPALIAAASISWSRMQRNQHYPADILTSVLLSICIGVPLGRAVRRQRGSSV